MIRTEKPDFEEFAYCESKYQIKISLGAVFKLKDLSSSGIKTLSLICWIKKTTKSKDLMFLDKYTLDGYNSALNENLSYNSLARGLNDLCKNGFIGKATRQGSYHINSKLIN